MTTPSQPRPAHHWLSLALHASQPAQWRARWCNLLAVMVAAISWLAFEPTSGPDLFEQADKLRHLAAFASLAAVAILAGEPRPHQARNVALWLLAYGAFIELVQSQLPTRSASALDWLADALGIALGLLLAGALRRLKK